MLSKADDYPIHQTPDPIAYAGSDRNFYDRYFFDGYSPDGALFFAAALGVYPNLNIMDAAFAVRIGERQYNLRASRHLGMERMDTAVGPIRIEVVEPLQRLRIVVDDNAHGIAAELTFEGRAPPMEEPRSTRRNGPRVLMDFTRLTQFGHYSGWIRVGGRTHEFAPRGLVGVRDRSWGVRAVGERDPQAMVPAQAHQFHWLWVTASFEDRALLFLLNEDAAGEPWHQAISLCHDDGRVEPLAQATVAVDYIPGTRWPRHARIAARDAAGGAWSFDLAVGPRFYMTGIGYMDPAWAHGINKGPLAIGYDEIDGAHVTYAPPHIYAQSAATVTATAPDGATLAGSGMVEHLSFGPHARLGFQGFGDGA